MNADAASRELMTGLVRLHILHHAARGPVFGTGLMSELAHHGYRLAPGTLYPILHGLERSGLLVSREELAEGRRRRTYTATAAGTAALDAAKGRVWELFRELFEDDLARSTPKPRRAARKE